MSWRRPACRRRLCCTSPLPTLPRLSSPVGCAAVLLTPRLGGGFGPVPQVVHVAIPVLSVSVVFVFASLMPRFQLQLVVMLRRQVCARMGCCVLVIEDVVEVSGSVVMLFDVLAVVDAFGALFTAAAGDENLDFSGTCVEAGSAGIPGAADGGLGSCFCQD